MSEIGRTHDDPGSTSPRRGARLLRRTGRGARWMFAGVGVILTGVLIGGTIADYSRFDRTSGGYEPPYTGWTGTPVDWDAALTSDSGFRYPGVVVDTILDCSTGMVSFEVFGIVIDWRVMSNRALVVHKPVEACESNGFETDFSASQP